MPKNHPLLNKHRHQYSLLAASIAAIATAGQSYAQELALEEVIVTAQKRSQSLQDVPISVNAVTGDKLESAGIENLQDLSSYVPNLKVVEGGLVPQLFVRGIGSGGNQGFEQSVATYSDGVFYGRSLQSRSAFMDIERVEVLRGPQSILFGKNSIAGAISLISAKPTDELEGYIGLKYAPEFSDLEVNGAVSGPLTDSLRGRLAFRTRDDDGWMKNGLTGNDQPQLEEGAVRGTLEWDASDNLSASLKIEHSQMDRNGRARQVITPGFYAVNPFIPALNDDNSIDDTLWGDGASVLDFESNNYVLKVDYESELGTWTSITAYSDYDYSELDYDGDTTEFRLNSLDMREEYEQFSQEIRLVSPGGDTLDYIVGAYYQSSDQHYLEEASIYVNDFAPNLGLGTNLKLDRPFTQKSDLWALFAQLTWNISDELRVSLGLRYGDEDKKGRRQQTTRTLDPLAGGLIPAGTPVFQTPALAALARGLSAGFRIVDHTLEKSRNESVLSPSINVQYDISDDTMLYASYSSGYKSGGFDARGINGATSANNPFNYSPISLGGDNFEFDEEEADTFEIGAKSSLLDGAAEINAALFYTEYDQLQASIFDGTFGFNVLNAGKATVKGVELDGRWRAHENLMLNSSMAYLDFEWKEFDEAPCPGVGNRTPSSSGVNCDFSGLENNQTPEWTWNLSMDYFYAINDQLGLNFILDAQFKDNHYTSGNLDARQEQGGATLYNTRISLSPDDDNWQLAISGKNLTDKRIQSYGADISLSKGFGRVPTGGVSTETLRPRTVAIEAIYRF